VVGHAVVLATGGYSNVYYLSTNAMNCNVTAIWRAHRKGALFANPCFTQIHPTCIPVSDEFQSKLTLMSESLRNDGRIWVPKDPDEKRPADEIPESDRDYYLERIYPAFGNLVPRDVASRNAKTQVDAGRGVGPLKNGVYLDFAVRHRTARPTRHRGALREPVRDVRADHRREPVRQPMRIYPAVHYTMGGLWVDYNLMTTIPGLFAIGEANFSDHGANRLGSLGAHAGSGRRLLRPAGTIGGYLADFLNEPLVPTDDPAFAEVHTEVRTGIGVPRQAGHPHRRRLPPPARPDRVGLRRHEPGRDTDSRRPCRRSLPSTRSSRPT
jgi:succinate dehydrogenase / fumarate reductase, flavoprotein subunit